MTGEPSLCIKGCGSFSTPQTMNLCSKCYSEFLDGENARNLACLKIQTETAEEVVVKKSEKSISRTKPRFETDEEPKSNPSGVVVGYNDLLPGPSTRMYPWWAGFGDGSMLVRPGDLRFLQPYGGDRPHFMEHQPDIPPPGASFDPIGLLGVHGFEPGRFARHPPRIPGSRRHPALEPFPGGSDFN